MTSIAARLEALVGREAVGVRPAGAGLPELAIASPKEPVQFAELFAFAARDALRVVPLGLGSKLEWTGPPDRVDFLVSTRNLAGTLVYEPGDGTISARAGTRMADLRATAARGGHWLSPDVPLPGEATLGGVLASGQSGFDRLRYGPSRDHVLGMQVMLADGKTARSGGQFVKNVTGYDLHRLYCGSQGTLCLILEAALRLFPLPEHWILLRAERSSRTTALSSAADLLRLLPRSTAVCVLPKDPEMSDGAWTVSATIASMRGPAEADCERALPSLAGAEVLRGGFAVEAAAQTRDIERLDGRWAHVQIQSRPSRLKEALERADQASAARGLQPYAIVHPGVATASIRWRIGGRPPQQEEGAVLRPLVRELRSSLEPLGAQLFVRSASCHVRQNTDPLGQGVPGLSLMRALRAALDPHGVLAPGRHRAGI